jgi:hypothetical protein
MNRNKMAIGDVTADTEIAWTTYRLHDGTRMVAVEALKPCGCDGPWLGSLRAVPGHKWPEEFKEQARHMGLIKLWEFVPVLKDGYSLAAEPKGMALGKMAAALALRDFVAERNQ